MCSFSSWNNNTNTCALCWYSPVSFSLCLWICHCMHEIPPYSWVSGSLDALCFLWVSGMLLMHDVAHCTNIELQWKVKPRVFDTCCSFRVKVTANINIGLVHPLLEYVLYLVMEFNKFTVNDLVLDKNGCNKEYVVRDLPVFNSIVQSPDNISWCLKKEVMCCKLLQASWFVNAEAVPTSLLFCMSYIQAHGFDTSDDRRTVSLGHKVTTKVAIQNKY